MIDVSIIIAAYRTTDILKSCLDSIQSAVKKYQYDVVVVDDDPSDDTAEKLVRQYHNITLIKNAKNEGFVRATNKGIAIANGRYVLCLNTDTEAKEGSVDALVSFADLHVDGGAFGPKLLNNDGSVQLQCHRTFPDPLNSLLYFLGISRLFNKSRIAGSYLMSYADNDLPMEVDSVCGAAIMVRKDVIGRIGAMDEDYVMYGDDIDWCYRIKEAGYKVYYVPAAEVLHHGGRGGSRRKVFRNIYEFHRAMYIYYGKHVAKKHFILLNILVYTGIGLKFFVTMLFSLLRKDKYVGTKKP